MAPRKESANSGGNGIRCNEERSEHSQADYELFLQAFEKPTQIYRYLKMRNLVSPTFLYRNLYYMRKRMSRGNATRKTFKVDSLLHKKEKERTECGDPTSALKGGGFITITFLGYYDKRIQVSVSGSSSGHHHHAPRSQSSSSVQPSSGRGFHPGPVVKLDLSLVNTTHKKRKESSSPVSQISLGSVEIPINPSDVCPPNKAPAISIPSKHIELADHTGGRVKTSTLFFRINSLDRGSVAGGQDTDENLEPAAKRRKLGRGLMEPQNMQDAVSSHAELTVTDKNSRFQLTEGEYELILTSTNASLGQANAHHGADLSTQDSNEERKFSPQKKKSNASWEIIDVEKTDKTIARQFEVFSDAATLKFRLSWATESAGNMVERPRPLMPRDNGQESAKKDKAAKKGDKGSKGQSQNSNRSGKDEDKVVMKPTRIVYQFLYNNNSRQLTEAREDMHCPWCGLNCMELVALLKHLKLSHPRFLFTYIPIHDGARIDVSVSELFDSTYVGNPHDMINQPPGYAFSRNGPVQRTTITNILVFKPKRVAPNLSEFLEHEDSENGHFENQRPFVSGHNRLYHNSTTCLPIPPHAIINNIDLEEEDRPDPEWLQIKTSRMIDDFTDVNEGEKELMKIWNNHVQKYTFVGDCQMPQALKMFIEEKGQLIVQNQLYSNFILHLVNLFEFGIIGPSHVFTAISKLQNLIRERGLQQDLAWTGWVRKSIARKMEGGQNDVAGRTGQTHQRKDFSGLFTKFSPSSPF